MCCGGLGFDVNFLLFGFFQGLRVWGKLVLVL